MLMRNCGANARPCAEGRTSGSRRRIAPCFARICWILFQWMVHRRGAVGSSLAACYVHGAAEDKRRSLSWGARTPCIEVGRGPRKADASLGLAFFVKPLLAPYIRPENAKILSERRRSERIFAFITAGAGKRRLRAPMCAPLLAGFFGRCHDGAHLAMRFPLGDFTCARHAFLKLRAPDGGPVRARSRRARRVTRTAPAGGRPARRNRRGARRRDPGRRG